MPHHIIHISASPKQLSKLRNGHKVRIKPAIEGEGFNLLVDPSRLNLMTRTFNRGKGVEISLTPQEIAVNQEATPQMQGSGIFGKKFDNFLEKNGMKEIAYKLGDASKPAVKALLLGGLGAGATALAGTETVASGGLGAGAIPLIYGTAGSLGALANDYLDNPSKYQTHRQTRNNVGGPINRIASSTLAGQVEQNDLLNHMNQQLGTKYGAMSQANIANADAQKMRSAMSVNRMASLDNTYNSGIDNGYGPANSIDPFAMTGGALRKRRERGSTGKLGSFVGAQTHLPPALKSQPFSANFQFQHTLPPAYQRFSKGGGLFV